MSEVFADTSGWASFFIRDDAHHDEAVRVLRDIRTAGSRLITTNYVLTQLVALYTSRMRTPRNQWILTI